jgi:hypothetical protein
MVRMLGEIRTGVYAQRWIAENEAGRPWFEARRQEERGTLVETVGERLRGMMPFLDPVTVTAEGDVKRAAGPGRATAAAAPAPAAAGKPVAGAVR